MISVLYWGHGCMKCSLGISNFLDEISSLSQPIVFLYFFALIAEEGFLISLFYSLELCIHMGISFLFSLPFIFLLFLALCKASSDNHFPFLPFFFLGMVLIPDSCTMSRTSVHSSSGSLSDLIPESNLSLPLYSHKGFDLGHTWIKWSSLNLVGRIHEIFWRMWLYELLRRESEIWGHRKEFSDYVGQQSYFTRGR